MTLQQLKYAVTIADAGSYNRAAEGLFVAQPSLTNAIKELERELEITIFYRSGRGVTLTEEGKEFISSARQIIGQSDMLLERFGKGAQFKKRFGVSTQHYSFATKAFVELVKKYGVNEYEFAIRETTTQQVISDVSLQKSEVGIIYLSEFNKTVLQRLLRANGLAFRKITECSAFVYLWKGHPLAGNESISFEELVDYPCLMFEQGGQNNIYLQEEILADKDYPQIIWANDRATILNLMVGLNGYTLCSGIICEELNGSDYAIIPFRDDLENRNSTMEIGYIQKSGAPLSRIAEAYIGELRAYLGLTEPQA